MHLGLDFGTSYTKLGCWESGRFINLSGREQRIPSVVVWLPSRNCLFFGSLACRLEEPGAVRADFFKLALKRNRDFTLGPFDLPDILHEFFSYLKREYLIKQDYTRVESLSLSIPNYFGLNSRRILIDAAQEVFEALDIYLVPEPVAAICGYNFKHPENRLQGDILSIDMGGGTTDFSFLRIMQDRQEILLETQLQMGHDAFSGSEIDLAILHQIFFPCFRIQHGMELPEQFWTRNFDSTRDKYIFNRMLIQAENLKITMSRQEQIRLDIPDFYNGKSLQLDIDQNIFRLQLEAIFERLKIFFTESLLQRAQNLNLFNGKHWQLDHVLLQGGASRCRGVNRLIRDLCPGVGITQPEDVEFNVVAGLSRWQEQGMANGSYVKSIFPFQFHIQTLDPVSKTPGLERICFDTANLDLDVRGNYKIFSFNPDSHYNLEVDNALLSSKIYEVEEGELDARLERFHGQDLVWRLDTLKKDAPETINIYLDMAESRLVSGDSSKAGAKKAVRGQELFKNFLLSEQKSLSWFSSFQLARPQLLADFKVHVSRKDENLVLPWQDHARTTRYKLLCLLDFLSRK